MLLDWTLLQICFNSNRMILNSTPLPITDSPSARISSTTRCPENQRRGCSKDCRVRNLLTGSPEGQIHEGKKHMYCLYSPSVGSKRLPSRELTLSHQRLRKIIVPTAFGPFNGICMNVLVPRRVLHSQWNVGENAVGGLSGIVLALWGHWNCFLNTTNKQSSQC